MVAGALLVLVSRAFHAAAIINGVNVRSAYDHLVRTQAGSSYGAYIWYQHWWNDNIRSTVEASGVWLAMNTNLLGGVTGIAPGGAVTTVGQLNKALAMAHANVFWSPVAFVDIGVEYAYGHRTTIANFKGDSNTLLGEFRVRF